MRYRASALLTLLLTVLFQAPEKNAHAIPAFSRQFNTECSTCHTIYPELNEYGVAFQKNAYVYSRPESGGGDGGPGKGEKSGRTTPGSGERIEGLLLRGIPRWFPLSVTANQTIAYDEGALDKKWSFTTRDVVLEGGGSFRGLAGIYGTFNLYAHDSANSPNGAPDGDSRVNELFLVGRRLLGTPLNVKVGRFEPKLSLWKKSDKVIVTSFAPASYKAGNSPFSLETAQDALEVNAVAANRLFLAAGIVDQEGGRIDGYGHLSLKIGGADFLGNEPEVDLEKESIWDYLALSMAFYGYDGKNRDPFGSDIRNSYYRIGGDLDIIYKRGRLRFSCVTGKDSNPEFIFPETERRSFVLASEGEYYFGSPVNLVGLFRYEYQDDGTAVVRRYIPALAYIPLQCLRLALEYMHEDQPQNVNRRLLLDVSLSF